MAWLWKTQLRIDLAIEKTRNEHLQAEIERLKVYIVKCENLIDHERQRVTDERERADRVNDSLLQQNGLPASTATVRLEQAEQSDKIKSEFERQMKELQEIYSETTEEMAGDSGDDFIQEIKAQLPAVQ